MEFFDTHTHLASATFQGDLRECVTRAQEALVTHWIAIGAGEGVAGNHAALKHAQEFEAAYAAIGIHPHDAKLWEKKLATELEGLAKDPRVKAWGEIGLDYHYLHSPQEIQTQAFEEQIELASKLDLSIILHTREAEEDTVQILKKHRSKIKRMVFHCFTGDKAFAKRIRDLDGYIGLGGILTFPKATELREAVADFPLERILLETDCPYLAPVPYRGKRNEPAYLPFVAHKLAEIKNLTLEEIAAQTTKNAFYFFNLA